MKTVRLILTLGYVKKRGLSPLFMVRITYDWRQALHRTGTVKTTLYPSAQWTFTPTCFIPPVSLIDAKGLC